MSKCKQCGTELAEGDGVMADITQRKSDGYETRFGRRRLKRIVVTEKLGPFCKDQPCAAHYQMGCEG